MIRLSFLEVLSIRVKHLEKRWNKWTGHASFWAFMNGAFNDRWVNSQKPMSNGIPIEPVKPTFSLHSDHSDWLYHINIINSIFTDLNYRPIFSICFQFFFSSSFLIFPHVHRFFRTFRSLFISSWKASPPLAASGPSQEVSRWPGAWTDPRRPLESRNCRSTAFRQYLGGRPIGSLRSDQGGSPGSPGSHLQVGEKNWSGKSGDWNIGEMYGILMG